MFCIKCGNKIPDKQVFCPDCLADMERYPIKPGTPVQLPARPVQAVPKRVSRKKEVPAEIRLKRQKKWITILCAMLIASWVGLGFTLISLIQELDDEAAPETVGRNYSTLLPEEDKP